MTILSLALLQAGLPLIACAWVAFGRPRSRLSWALVCLAVAAWLVAGRLVGLWLFPPPWVPLALLVVLAAAITRGYRSASGIAWLPRGRGSLGELTVAILLTSAAGLAIVQGDAGRRPGGPGVELTFPLRHGSYHILSAGSNQLANPHVMTLSNPSFRVWRGQSFGVDIVRLNAFGLRAAGIAPEDPERYGIFDDQVYAPCVGRVDRAEDGAEDLPAGRRDRSRIAGNYVLIDCGEFQVLLGHLRRGRVIVTRGDSVHPQSVVGRVGNSGNTDEPHLHIHAQRASADPRNPFAGDPLTMQFEGRLLYRNDIVGPVTTGLRQSSDDWTPSLMLYAQIASCLVALGMLLASLRSPRLGRWLFVALFAWAAQVNWRTAISQPEVYLDYAMLAALPQYRDFILGFFARHITLVVCTIAIAQGAIAVLLLMRTPFPRVALVGAIVFLLAIAPLGVGSGFPATVIMAMAAGVVWRRDAIRTAPGLGSRAAGAGLQVVRS